MSKVDRCNDAVFKCQSKLFECARVVVSIVHYSGTCCW